MGESFDIVLIEHGGGYDSNLVILHCSAVRFPVCCKESAPQYGTLKPVQDIVPVLSGL